MRCTKITAKRTANICSAQKKSQNNTIFLALIIALQKNEPQIFAKRKKNRKAQIFADCKIKRKTLRKQKRKNNRKIPMAPYSHFWSRLMLWAVCMNLSIRITQSQIKVAPYDEPSTD